MFRFTTLPRSIAALVAASALVATIITPATASTPTNVVPLLAWAGAYNGQARLNEGPEQLLAGQGVVLPHSTTWTVTTTFLGGDANGNDPNGVPYTSGGRRAHEMGYQIDFADGNSFASPVVLPATTGSDISLSQFVGTTATQHYTTPLTGGAVTDVLFGYRGMTIDQYGTVVGADGAPVVALLAICPGNLAICK